jgi:hypothetical protein
VYKKKREKKFVHMCEKKIECILKKKYTGRKKKEKEKRK